VRSDEITAALVHAASGRYCPQKKLDHAGRRVVGIQAGVDICAVFEANARPGKSFTREE
jgi:hypothetical protein